MPQRGVFQAQSESNTGLSSNCSSGGKPINLRSEKKKKKSVDFHPKQKAAEGGCLPFQI